MATQKSNKGLNRKINKSFHKSTKKTKSAYRSNIITAVIILAMLIGLNDLVFKIDALPTYQGIYKALSLSEKPPAINGEVSVHYIDVGQGDSQLIVTPTHTVLIDSGEAPYASKVINYIKSLGITKLDYVIVTHHHSDHMGSMAEVIKTIKTNRIIMPDIDEYYLPTTRAFEKLLTAVNEDNIPITYAAVNHNIHLGDDINLVILAPIKEYDDMNNSSVVVKLIHKNNSFLFTGDIEKEVEADLLAKQTDLSATVLKVGHHGSNSSSSADFLNAVKPLFAVIQVSSDNTYGHPHKEVVSRLQKIEAKMLRNDILGDIVISSDGEGISISSQKGEFSGQDSNHNVNESKVA